MADGTRIGLIFLFRGVEKTKIIGISKIATISTSVVQKYSCKFVHSWHFFSATSQDGSSLNALFTSVSKRFLTS
jgi:hypothetical protein